MGPVSPFRPIGYLCGGAERRVGGGASLILISHATGFFFLDLGETGYSFGDTFMRTGKLYNAARTKVVGRDQHTCVINVWALDCSASFFLFGRGQIRSDGTLFRSNTPVTGGTGDFVGVGGARWRFSLPQKGDELDVLKLVR